MVLTGGPLDGQEVKDELELGMEMHFPFTDDDWLRTTSEWQERYGAAHAWAMAGREPWNGPEPPSFPKWVYRNTPDGWVYAGERR